MSDVLAGLSVEQVATFYSRLADAVDANKGAVSVSLAAILLREWLKNRNPKYEFNLDAPQHLKNQTDLNNVLKYHRAVFLTEKKARIGDAEKWVGLVPRWQGKGYPKWNGVGELIMEYQSLVEIPLYYQLTGSDADKDILYALHGFQLKSRVSISLTNTTPGSANNVVFNSFETQVIDRYDWDYNEHLTVPNPDFGSKSPNAILPASKTVKVYHRNAERVEKAGLAAPYDLKSKPWAITDTAITGPATVNLNKAI
ncbi:MAG: hypothetical protein HC846_01355 [Blastocatellia bacterium]|nr:hypothetical protein [Blastocatellia bacterium]